MARIILGSYAVRFPVGGYLSWVLQWLVGFQRLGHDVYFVEKCGWPQACYDPRTDEMGDDCSYGVAALAAALAPFDLDQRFCFVDALEVYHGMDRGRVEATFDTADLFVDMGAHASWLEEASRTGLRVLVDLDPGYTQMRALLENDGLPGYDHYYSVGQNVGRAGCEVPTLGQTWRHVFNPVVPELFTYRPAPPGAAFSTVMTWQTYRELDFEGRIYGQKDVEFRRFIDLPGLTDVPLEVAVAGYDVPTDRMVAAGWRVENPVARTRSVETFYDYISASRGEFTVCKNVYVATRSGFFSDRSAAYLASGRPVVMQATGLDGRLPTGAGFFTFQTAEEAVAALEAIDAEHERHASAARALVTEYLDASKVLTGFLTELGIPSGRVAGAAVPAVGPLGVEPPVSTPAVEARVLEGFDDPLLGPARWNALLARGDSNVVYLTWEWLKAWWETLGRGRLLLIAAEKDGEVVAVAPFFADAGMVFFLGAGVSDYLDFIGDVGEPEVLDSVLRTARAQVPGFVGFRLYCVLETSRTAGRLRTTARRLELECFEEKRWPAPVIDLAKSPDVVRTLTDSRLVSRHERYFRNRGTLTLRRYHDGQTISAHLEAFFEQHISLCALDGHPSPFLQRPRRAFWERLTEMAGDTGWLRFNLLDCDGRPIACEYGCCYGGTYVGGPSSSAVDLARRSPGHVLLKHLLLAAIEEGVETYDLGLGEDRYKFRLATRLRHVSTWGLYPAERVQTPSAE